MYKTIFVISILLSLPIFCLISRKRVASSLLSICVVSHIFLTMSTLFLKNVEILFINSISLRCIVLMCPLSHIFLLCQHFF